MARRCAPGTGAGGGVADERSGGGDDSLLAGAASCGVRMAAAVVAIVVDRGRGSSAGGLFGGVLFITGDLRAEMGQHC